MNLKEIQDNAPEGATHYEEILEDEYYYFKDAGSEKYIWQPEYKNEPQYWKLLDDSHMFMFVRAKELYPTQETRDPTNPQHYKQGKVECIDAIESAVVSKKGIEASLVGNIIKYLWRYEEKNGVEDVEKAKWYLDKLLEKLK